MKTRGNNEIINRSVGKLMNPDGREQIATKGFTFKNVRLEAVARANNLICEKVSFTPLNNGGWELNNITRGEGYELDPNAQSPLPTRINEKEYIKALNSLKAVNPNVCVNAILVKEPKKVNYRVAYMELVDFAHAWVF